MHSLDFAISHFEMSVHLAGQHAFCLLAIDYEWFIINFLYYSRRSCSLRSESAINTTRTSLKSPPCIRLNKSDEKTNYVLTSVSIFVMLMLMSLLVSAILPAYKYDLLLVNELFDKQMKITPCWILFHFLTILQEMTFRRLHV